MKQILYSIGATYVLASTIILCTGICVIMHMSNRVDYKYCSDNGTPNYYTVTGRDTTRYQGAWAISDFSLKWVPKR